MKETNFYEGLQNLGSYFGKQLSQEQRLMYFRDLEYISERNFEAAVRSIVRSKKPNPGQFPTIFEIRGMCPPDDTKHYNPDEDLNEYYQRITVKDLWQGLKILESQGAESFKSFCRTNHFRNEDIERVEYKHKVANTQEQAKKLTEGIG